MREGRKVGIEKGRKREREGEERKKGRGKWAEKTMEKNRGKEVYHQKER